jgi:hypothetical protein
VEPTNGHRVLVANLAAKRARLGKTNVVGFTWRTAADHARLRVDKLAVILVPQSVALAGKRRRAAFGGRVTGAAVEMPADEKKGFAVESG